MKCWECISCFHPSESLASWRAEKKTEDLLVEAKTSNVCLSVVCEIRTLLGANLLYHVELERAWRSRLRADVRFAVSRGVKETSSLARSLATLEN